MSDDATRARFPGLTTGYESFFLRACAPQGGLGVWIRYTVRCGRGQQPTGSLWCTLFDADAPAPLAAKLTIPEAASGVGDDWIGIGAARLGAGSASGEIRTQGAPPAAWNLQFTGAEPFWHLSRSWMYRAPLPRTKPISIHPVAVFDGTLTVAGRSIDVSRWPGMVGHNWGSQHAERWIWLHTMSPDTGGETTWLDVVLARIKFAGRTTPWIASGGICVDGKRVALGGAGRAGRTKITETPHGLDFVLPGARMSVSGTVHAPQARFVGWVYADPDGSRHHVANCSIADLSLRVDRPGRTATSLQTAGLAAYELGTRERDAGRSTQPFTDG